MRLSILLVAAVACTRPPIDTQSTRQMCGIDRLGLIDEVIPDLTDECRWAIRADFAMDDSEADDGAYESFYGGAWSLLAHDWVHDNYSWIASSFRRGHFDHDDERSEAARAINGMLIVHDDLGSPPIAASVLYHESVHARGGRDTWHVACPDGRFACDETVFGAYGMQAWMLETGAERTRGDVGYFLTYTAEGLRRRIIGPQ